MAGHCDTVSELGSATLDALRKLEDVLAAGGALSARFLVGQRGTLALAALSTLAKAERVHASFGAASKLGFHRRRRAHLVRDGLTGHARHVATSA